MASSGSLVRMTPAAWAAERLVSGRGGDVGVRNGRRMQSGCNESGEVRHIDQQVGTDLVGDLPEPLEVQLTRVGRPAGDDQLGSVLPGQSGDLVHVDPVVLLGHLVGHDVVQQAGEVDPHPVGEVPTVGQREPEDRVARLDQRLHGRGVRLRAGVRLDVGEARAEQFLDPRDGQPLGDVDVLATPVVAPARVSLGVLVGHHRTLGLQRCDRREVLAGDHLQGLLLAPQLRGDCGVDLRVRLGQ